MRTHNTMLDYAGRSLDAAPERLVLGRIGQQLALVYHDVLRSPLPPHLRELVDRLDRSSLAPETRDAKS